MKNLIYFSRLDTHSVYMTDDTGNVWLWGPQDEFYDEKGL